MTPLFRMTAATSDVLRTLVDGDGGDGRGVWGMLVIKRTGRPAGSVYPILERLEGAGWVSSSWESASERSGPRRRLYELTSEGAETARGILAKAATSEPRKSGHRESEPGGSERRAGGAPAVRVSTDAVPA